MEYLLRIASIWEKRPLSATVSTSWSGALEFNRKIFKLLSEFSSKIPPLGRGRFQAAIFEVLCERRMPTLYLMQEVLKWCLGVYIWGCPGFKTLYELVALSFTGYKDTYILIFLGI